jgi:hypothetical protein
LGAPTQTPLPSQASLMPLLVQGFPSLQALFSGFGWYSQAGFPPSSVQIPMGWWQFDGGALQGFGVQGSTTPTQAPFTQPCAHGCLISS